MQPQVRTIGDTIQLTFTTVNLSGVPTALVGGAIGLLRGGATSTETTGVSLAVDVGSVTGRNVVTIRTSEAGFKTGVDYAVVLTAGTVDSVNVRDRVGSFRLTPLPLQSSLTPAQRLLDGRSVVGGIGDSYTSPVATWRCVADWDIAHSGPRMRMRGESLLMDGQNPFSTKGAAAQTGIRFDVAPGATFPGTAIVNRFAFSVASCWNGSLANGTAFTPGVFGNDIAANTGLYLNPNLLPIDIGAIDSWLSYIGGAHNVTSMRQLTRRDVSVGQVGSTAFNPTLQSGYASAHTTLTAMTGTGGAIDCVAQLQTTMTSKTWIQLGYGWVAKDQPLGIVYGPVWGFGGAATADFATAAGGLVTAWTDDQVHAWFAAAAASGYPIDILRVNLGINEFGLTPIADLYLQLLERWITIGQQYTKERFGILALTPAPWIANGTPKTDTTEFHRDEIAAAVDAFGDPLRVQLVDVHQAMRDLNGSVADWGPVYLQQTGSTYLHPTAAGGVAFGAAAYRALEDAASDLVPTVKEAITRKALLAAADYTAPPTVSQIRTEMDSNSTKLATLPASGVVPNTTQVATPASVNDLQEAIDAIPTERASVHLKASGADLVLTISAFGETISSYDLTGVAIGRSAPEVLFTSSASGTPATTLTATVPNQAALATEDVDISIEVTTTESGVIPAEKIRWRPQPAVLAAIGEIEAASGVVGNPYDDDPVGDALLYEVSPPNGSSAGTVRGTVRLLAAGGGRFGLDMRLLTGSNLASVESVTLDAAATTAGWTVTDYSEWPGGVWEKTAIITLDDITAGDEGQLTVVATNKDGQTVAAKVNIVID